MKLLVQARPAKPEDLESVNSLAREMVGAIQNKRGGAALLASQPIESNAAQGWYSSGDASLVVATADSEVVGFALGTASLEVFSLHWIFIHNAARRVGLGSALLDSILNQAERQGCKRFDSVALPGDARTKNFFESYGIKARLLTVSREL